MTQWELPEGVRRVDLLSKCKIVQVQENNSTNILTRQRMKAMATPFAELTPLPLHIILRVRAMVLLLLLYLFLLV